MPGDLQLLNVLLSSSFRAVCQLFGKQVSACRQCQLTRLSLSFAMIAPGMSLPAALSLPGVANVMNNNAVYGSHQGTSGLRVVLQVKPTLPQIQVLTLTTTHQAQQRQPRALVLSVLFQLMLWLLLPRLVMLLLSRTETTLHHHVLCKR